MAIININLNIKNINGASILGTGNIITPHLGNTDLIADANRSYNLVSNLVGGTFDIKTLSAGSIIQFRGDNSIHAPTSNIGFGGTPSANQRLFVFSSTHSFTSTFQNTNVNGTGLLVNALVNNNVTGIRIDANTAGGVGVRTGIQIDASNGSINYAINILKGNINTGVGSTDFLVGGGLNTDHVAMRTSSTDIVRFRGDNSIFVPTGVIGLGGAPDQNIGINIDGKATGIKITNATSDGILVDSASTNSFRAVNSNSSGKGYSATMSGTGTVFGGLWTVSGVSANNIGLRLDVKNSVGLNLALDLLSGDIRVPTGGLGQTETVTFGGGSTGDIASMTFEKGIYISKTLVP